MTELRLRRLRRVDKQTLLRMRLALWPASRATSDADFRGLFGRRGAYCVLAWDGATAVGFAEATLRPFANGCESRPVPFLEGLWVDPAHRRQGIGRALVRAVEDWALARGFHELGSDAYLDARISHRAHRAYGFRETERVVYFRKALARRSRR